MSTKRARWIVALAIVCGAAFIAWSLADREEDLPGRLSIELARVSRGYVAQVAISNRSPHRLRIECLLEVKTGGKWPVYGPSLSPMRWRVAEVLEPETKMLVRMRVPNYGEKWRIVVEHQPAPGWLYNLRSSTAAMLAARGWSRLAHAITPNPRPFARTPSAEWPVRDSPWVRQ